MGASKADSGRLDLIPLRKLPFYPAFRSIPTPDRSIQRLGSHIRVCSFITLRRESKGIGRIGKGSVSFQPVEERSGDTPTVPDLYFLPFHC